MPEFPDIIAVLRRKKLTPKHTALQMHHVYGGLLTHYGADVFGTAWIYATTRLVRTIFQRGRIVSPKIAAIVVFALCGASELGQKLHLMPGRHDTYDLLAYALTIAACWLVECKLAPFARPALAIQLNRLHLSPLPPAR